jgi:hypothetical protein
MAYIGVSPSNGVRKKHTYTATASQTSFSGAGAEGITLAYRDSNYVDVYQNGVKLADEDYTATSGTAIVLAQGASADDIVEIIAFDVFSVADTVSKADGGTFDGNVTMAGTLGVTGVLTGTSLDISGDIDVDGTTNLDVVDIDGAVDMASTLTVAGTLSSAGGLVHQGDANTSLDFGTDQQTFYVGGVRALDLSTTGTVFNEGGADVDFRVESDTVTHALFLEGSSGNVGINTSSPTAGYMLHVGGSSGVHTKVKIEATTATGQAELDLSADPAGVSYLNLGDEDSHNIGYLGYFHSDNSMRFQTNSAERMRVTSTGRFLVGGLTTGNGDDEALQVYRNGAITLSVARQQDGTIVNFRVGSVDGAAHGTISISGTTCSYNAFSGSHWSRLADNSKPTILKGTIIETIDEMCDWYRAEFTVEATTKEDTDSESETFGQQIEDVAEHIASKPIELPSGGAVGDTISVTSNGITYDNAVIAKEGDEKHVKCKISDTADSKKVYGVHAAWDNDDDTVNDMYVTAVGTHVVRINGSVTVSAGDLLASNGDGTAKVQDDDIIRSKTIGKVLTNIKQETYDDGSYTVPCALYCG